MRAKEVLSILKITRPTLCSYVKKGYIRAIKNPNGQLTYNDDDVYKLCNKDPRTITVLYYRGSRKERDEELDILRKFCNSNGYVIYGEFIDVSQLSSLAELSEKIIEKKIGRVVMKDSNFQAYKLFEEICKSHNCEIVVMRG